MNTNDTFQVWIVIKNGSSWTGRKFSGGPYDAKLFGMESEAKITAAKHGATVQAFQLAASK